MRNYICYFSGLVEFIDGDQVYFGRFVAAEDEEAFKIAAQVIFDREHDHFAWTVMRLTAQKMYFRMDKESVLWVLNGMTKNGDVLGEIDPSPAEKGQFGRTSLPELIPNLTDFFVAESPRDLRGAV